MILRDPAGRQIVQVLEQNYRNDPGVAGAACSRCTKARPSSSPCRNQDGSTTIVNGRIVRSGYVPHYQAMNRYGTQYQANQMAMASPTGTGQPIIEVDGKLQFSAAWTADLSHAWPTTRFSNRALDLDPAFRRSRAASTPS